MHHSEHLTQTHTASCWVSLPEISVLEVLPLQRESSYLELILHLHLLVEVGGGNKNVYRNQLQEYKQNSFHFIKLSVVQQQLVYSAKKKAFVDYRSGKNASYNGLLFSLCLLSSSTNYLPSHLLTSLFSLQVCHL